MFGKHRRSSLPSICSNCEVMEKKVEDLTQTLKNTFEQSSKSQKEFEEQMNLMKLELQVVKSELTTRQQETEVQRNRTEELSQQLEVSRIYQQVAVSTCADLTKEKRALRSRSCMLVGQLLSVPGGSGYPSAAASGDDAASVIRSSGRLSPAVIEAIEELIGEEPEDDDLDEGTKSGSTSADDGPALRRQHSPPSDRRQLDELMINVVRQSIANRRSQMEMSQVGQRGEVNRPTDEDEDEDDEDVYTVPSEVDVVKLEVPPRPEPQPEPQSEPTEPQPEPQTEPQPEPQTEPQPEPQTEPQLPQPLAKPRKPLVAPKPMPAVPSQSEGEVQKPQNLMPKLSLVPEMEEELYEKFEENETEMKAGSVEDVFEAEATEKKENEDREEKTEDGEASRTRTSRLESMIRSGSIDSMLELLRQGSQTASEHNCGCTQHFECAVTGLCQLKDVVDDRKRQLIDLQKQIAELKLKASRPPPPPSIPPPPPPPSPVIKIQKLAKLQQNQKKQLAKDSNFDESLIEGLKAELKSRLRGGGQGLRPTANRPRADKEPVATEAASQADEQLKQRMEKIRRRLSTRVPAPADNPRPVFFNKL